MTISVQDLDGTAMLIVDRPPVNAIDLDTVLEMERALRGLSAAPPERGMVLTGTGHCFSAGVDTRFAAAADAQQRAELVLGIDRAAALLFALPFPVVAALPGHAIGGGLVIALACDWRIAADRDARFGLTEVTAGIPYPAVPMEIVCERVSEPHRSRLVLGGELVDLRQALALGLLDACVAAEDLVQRALERARALSTATSYAIVKRQLRRAVNERIAAIVASGTDPLLA